MANSDTHPLAEILEVKEENEKDLLVLPNVVGAGIGYKETRGKEGSTPCIHVYVEKKVAKEKLAPEALVPAKLDGVKTDVREVGKVEALAFKSRLRPAAPGYSIGHYRITAGTFGCLVRDACEPCRVYILSNNHVLANSNAAAIGDPVLQPGRADGGTHPRDLIGRLHRFVPIRFNSQKRYNLVDAALAKPIDHRAVIASIAGLGIPRGTVEATLGMEVIKAGRTTGITTGRVTGIDVTIAVGFGAAGTAYFHNQIITTDMSSGGDSGSLLLSRKERKATGLLFAGSSKITVHNNIANVLMALGVEMVTV